MRAFTSALAFSCLAMAVVAPVASAQEYPVRPIRFVVAFSAGGVADLLARQLGQRLGERFGQQVIIDNRAGGGGVIGVEIAARAAPDGYTVLMGSSSNFSIAPGLGGKLPYDPLRSFVPLTQVANVPVMLVVHPAFQARTTAELIQVVRAKPGQFSYASTGAGGGPHIAGELFKRLASVDLVHVPYKGGGEAVSAVLGQHVTMSFGAVSTAVPHVRAGRLRALGVSSARRLAAAPEVPTIAESGVPGYEVVQWFGVFAPAGIAPALVTRLAREMAAVVNSTEMQERFASQGVETISSTPEAFARHVREELVKWTRLLKEMGIQRGEGS